LFFWFFILLLCPLADLSFLGLLFAQPLATFLMLAVYNERLQDEQISIEQEPPPIPGNKA